MSKRISKDYDTHRQPLIHSYKSEVHCFTTLTPFSSVLSQYPTAKTIFEALRALFVEYKATALPRALRERLRLSVETMGWAASNGVKTEQRHYKEYQDRKCLRARSCFTPDKRCTFIALNENLWHRAIGGWLVQFTSSKNGPFRFFECLSSTVINDEEGVLNIVSVDLELGSSQITGQDVLNNVEIRYKTNFLLK